MLSRLTDEQCVLLSVVRDEWIAIGLSTAPADRPAAEAAIPLVYAAAGLPPPAQIVWHDSPYAGAVEAARAAVGAQAGEQVWDQVEAQVREQVEAQVRAQVWAQAWAQVWEQVEAQVRAQVEAQVEAQVREQVWLQVQAQVWDQVEARAWVRAGYGQHAAARMSFYDCFGRLGLARQVEPFRGVMGLVRSCGWWWGFQRLAILTERPCRLQRDARGRLHGGAGAALQYPDGWGIWAWHGVRVPADVIEYPERQTVEQITAEPNVEIRRVRLERFGAARYLREIGALPVHADETGTLYRVDLADDEPLALVAVENCTPEEDGSRKPYYLRVPPTMTTAREAVAWTFDHRPEDYRPSQES